ncbi:MAG TPA: malto-oligosyltrehalose trehalohydrolase [Pseudolysinimonas sp.]|nr:malto-oligosyltrehalose trehalohydrolase [Pseudolysinimonas sp.]
MKASVWAPLAERVRIIAAGEVRDLTRDENDWWHDDVELADGTRYGFLLDDDAEPVHDPRSRSLPDGVHGLGQVVETPDPQPWAGRDLAGGVIYEMHIGTFTEGGTLDAAIGRLDELVALGVDFVEPLPVNGFNGERNWGYDGVAWYAVDDTYGGPHAYVRFVDACHARGLGVIQDVVYNHFGPSGNYLPRFGPYLDDANANTWGANVNLAEPAVRRYILDNARLWFETYGVDGLRLDAVHALVDPTPRHILSELSQQTQELQEWLERPLTLIAESDLNDPVMILPRDEGGYGMTAQWCDDYHHAVHSALTGEADGYYSDFASLSALAKAATKGFVHDGTFSTFRGRPHGSPIPPEVPRSRLVTFVQDHDQIGNRAEGDRLTEALSDDRLAVAAVLNLCSPFTPMIFMGEEWAASTPWQFFTGHPEPELGEATAEGRIAEFAQLGWDPEIVPDPQDPETFRRSHLDWGERERDPHRRILDLYRELIALRRREPEFSDPRFSELSAESDDDAKTFRLRLGAVQVLVNLGTGDWDAGAGRMLLATSPRVRVSAAGVVLPPDTAAVLRMPDVESLNIG